MIVHGEHLRPDLADARPDGVPTLGPSSWLEGPISGVRGHPSTVGLSSISACVRVRTTGMAEATPASIG